jgi:hypothetical protein
MPGGVGSLLNICRAPSRSCGSLPAWAVWSDRRCGRIGLTASAVGSTADFVVGCCLGTRGCVCPPTLRMGSASGNGPCGFTLPLQHGTRVLSFLCARPESTSSSPGWLLCSSSDVDGSCRASNGRRSHPPLVRFQSPTAFTSHVARCPVLPASGRSRFGVGVGFGWTRLTSDPAMGRSPLRFYARLWRRDSRAVLGESP